MRLRAVSPQGRMFLMQFFEIMKEFGHLIPWLHGLDELKYATNGQYFRDELMRRTGQKSSLVTPYQFVQDDEPRTFIGGILHFEKTPERFRDRDNNETAERLAAEGASYISCLQVRSGHREAGIGTGMTARALRVILAEKGPVWGVVSDANLLPWYRSLGARLMSSPQNKDDLWIVHWNDHQ